MRNLIILLCYLCIPLILQANSTNPPVPFETANIDKTEELLCTLPAPANISFPYSAANNNTTSIAMSWPNVANAVNYNVGTYVTATGAFVSNTVVTTTSTTITSLSPGTCYTFYVSAGCGGGAFSPNNISGAACTDFVIDLISSGYQNCAPTQNILPNTPVGASTSINISAGLVYAGVVTQTSPPPPINTLPAQKHIRFQLTEPTVFTMQQVPAPQGVPELGDLSSPTCQLTADNIQFASITSCNVPEQHCRIKFGPGNNGAYIMSISDVNNTKTYSISLYNTTCSGGDGRTTMDDVSLANEITVAPNPFNDEFNLIIPGIETLDQSVSIQLFDMNGKICHAQELAPRTTSDVIRIPSSDLPTGIYFLRARVGDTVKTIKVMKSNQ